MLKQAPSLKSDTAIAANSARASTTLKSGTAKVYAKTSTAKAANSARAKKFPMKQAPHWKVKLQKCLLKQAPTLKNVA